MGQAVPGDARSRRVRSSLSRCCATSWQGIGRTGRRFEREATWPRRSAIPTSFRSWTPESDSGTAVPRGPTYVDGPSLGRAHPRGRRARARRGLLESPPTSARGSRRCTARAGPPGREAREVMLDRDGMALVTDFGLAKGPAMTTLTRSGVVVGHAAVPGARGDRGDRGGDARPPTCTRCGCLVYACLAGRPPFTGSLIEVAYAHLDEEPDRPCSRPRRRPAGRVGGRARSARQGSGGAARGRRRCWLTCCVLRPAADPVHTR